LHFVEAFKYGIDIDLLHAIGDGMKDEK